jgi:hypothetical protein
MLPTPARGTPGGEIMLTRRGFVGIASWARIDESADEKFDGCCSRFMCPRRQRIASIARPQAHDFLQLIADHGGSSMEAVVGTIAEY